MKKLQSVPKEIQKIIATGNYPFSTSRWMSSEPFAIHLSKDKFQKANSSSSLLPSHLVSIGGTSWGDPLVYNAEKKRIEQLDHEQLFSQKKEIKVSKSWKTSNTFFSFIKRENRVKTRKYSSNFLNNLTQPGVLPGLIKIWLGCLLVLLLVVAFVYWAIQ